MWDGRLGKENDHVMSIVSRSDCRCSKLLCTRRVGISIIQLYHHPDDKMVTDNIMMFFFLDPGTDQRWK